MFMDNRDLMDDEGKDGPAGRPFNVESGGFGRHNASLQRPGTAGAKSGDDFPGTSQQRPFTAAGGGDDGAFGSAGALPSSGANRAKILQQQRELQKKRRAQRMSSGMMRAVDGPGGPRSPERGAQHTPAMRQWSQPRPMTTEGEASQFSSAPAGGLGPGPGDRDRGMAPRGPGFDRGPGYGGVDRNAGYDDRGRGGPQNGAGGYGDRDQDRYNHDTGTSYDRDRRNYGDYDNDPRDGGRYGDRDRDYKDTDDRRDRGYNDRDYEDRRGGRGDMARRERPPRDDRDRDYPTRSYNDRNDRDQMDDRAGRRDDRPRGRGDDDDQMYDARRGMQDDNYDNYSRGGTRGDRGGGRDARDGDGYPGGDRQQDRNQARRDDVAAMIEERERRKRDDAEYNRRPRRDDDTAAQDPSVQGGGAGSARAEDANVVRGIDCLDFSDMRSFLMKPTPKAAGVVQCQIKRNKSGGNKMFPEYILTMKDGDRFLMCSKKRPHNKTSNYLVSMQRGDTNRESDNYLGKLRANFIGTEFVVYDKGDNPRDVDADSLQQSQRIGIRQELGCVLYASNVLGSRGPRKMKVYIPKVTGDEERALWKPLNKDDEMLNKIKEPKQDLTDLVFLINKPPRWNEQVGAYVLNFNGRVTMASVKNFQLVQPDDQEAIVLQFGRVGKDDFTMDYQWPLSPFQAFSITLSSFDSKLACE